MKKQICILTLLLLIITGVSACSGSSNGSGKRDTTTTMGGDVSNKDTLLDKGKSDKMDTGKEKASMRKK